MQYHLSRDFFYETSCLLLYQTELGRRRVKEIERRERGEKEIESFKVKKKREKRKGERKEEKWKGGREGGEKERQIEPLRNELKCAPKPERGTGPADADGYKAKVSLLIWHLELR